MVAQKLRSRQPLAISEKASESGEAVRERGRQTLFLDGFPVDASPLSERVFAFMDLRYRLLIPTPYSDSLENL
jgi:hypothetical protein